MKKRAKEWLYLVLKIFPIAIILVGGVKYMVIIEQESNSNSSEINKVESNITIMRRRMDKIENNSRNYVTLSYFRSDNKIVKSDIMWGMDRIYILQGMVAMNSGEIRGEHSR